MTREQLHTIPQDTIIEMYLALTTVLEQMSSQMETLRKQNEEQTGQNKEQMERIRNLEESIAILTQKRFGRSTEKGIDTQLSFDMNGNIIDPNVVNEAEELTKDGVPDEPEYEEVVVRRKKHTGKRAEDVSRVKHVVEPTVELSGEDLAELFPGGYNRLPDEVYTDVEHIPEQFIAHEHHYAVYGAKNGSLVIRASEMKKPNRLLNNSILTESLFAAVFEGRYVLNMPYNRIHDDFARRDMNISRQVIAGWSVKVCDRYLRYLYKAMTDKQMEAHLIHCDETPFVLSHCREKDNKRVKAYMWVYHTCRSEGSPPIFIYQYQPGRKAEYPAEYLKNYHGILMTDGYQAYHTLEKENPEQFTVVGCWTHAKRPFSDYLKAVGKNSRGTIAEEAVARIQAIYHTDNMYRDKPPEERLKHRQTNVRPLVDAYFAWLKSLTNLDKGSKIYRAVNYSLNQEVFLRRFLDDPLIPLDNNAAERSIRTFCQGKHACNSTDSEAGAETSGILYSIAETAKANGLKPYEYMKYVLGQMLLHLDDKPSTYMNDIVPWSDKIPQDCIKLDM